MAGPHILGGDTACCFRGDRQRELEQARGAIGRREEAVPGNLFNKHMCSIDLGSGWSSHEAQEEDIAMEAWGSTISDHMGFSGHHAPPRSVSKRCSLDSVTEGKVLQASNARPWAYKPPKGFLWGDEEDIYSPPSVNPGGKLWFAGPERTARSSQKLWTWDSPGKVYECEALPEARQEPSPRLTTPPGTPYSGAKGKVWSEARHLHEAQRSPGTPTHRARSLSWKGLPPSVEQAAASSPGRAHVSHRNSTTFILNTSTGTTSPVRRQSSPDTHSIGRLGSSPERMQGRERRSTDHRDTAAWVELPTPSVRGSPQWLPVKKQAPRRTLFDSSIPPWLNASLQMLYIVALAFVIFACAKIRDINL